MAHPSHTTVGAPELRPDCGRRRLPVVIDQLARDNPERPWPQSAVLVALNTRETHLDLMDQTQSKILLSAEAEVTHALVPELDDLLSVDTKSSSFPL